MDSLLDQNNSKDDLELEEHSNSLKHNAFEFSLFVRFNFYEIIIDKLIGPSLQARDRLNDVYLVCDLKLELRDVENNKHFLDSLVFIENFKKFEQ